MDLPKPLAKEGFTIPLKASFVVFKRLSFLGVAHNNIAPGLTLFEDRLEYRVLKLVRRSYADIEAVDARRWLGTQTLILHWRAGLFAFGANVGDDDRLIALLAFFEARGVKFAPRARDILNAARKK
jgi:hypothetical protein